MNTQNIKNIFKLSLIMMLCLVFSSLFFIQSSQAKQGEEKLRTSSEIKEVQGEISGISDNYISVVYQKDKKSGMEYEVLLPIDKNIKLVHKQDIGQLNIGDTVRIKYEEYKEESDKYKKGFKLKREARVITFVKPAVVKPEYIQPEVEESLPLKGIKGE